MKKLLLMTTLMAVLSQPAMAQNVDIIGGPDASTQTIHHCGFLPTTSKRYTTTSATTRIVERKLSGLGYKNVSTDGTYGKRDKAAVRSFQQDYGLQVDGIVGPITARHLAFASHPSSNVKRCYRATTGIR